MDINIIIFTEEKYRSFIVEQRTGLENKTNIHVMNFTQLELYQDYNTIKNIMQSPDFHKDHQLLKHPEGFLPEYNILMNSKFFLLQKATEMNVFNSTHFFWMDFGYGHGSDIFPKSRKWAPVNIMSEPEDKVTYIMVQWLWGINSLLDVYKRDICGILSGGFFGGSKKAVQELYKTHKWVFRTCLDAGVVDDDQTIIIGCVQANKNLFNFVSGDWFDVIKLFH